VEGWAEPLGQWTQVGHMTTTKCNGEKSWDRCRLHTHEVTREADEIRVIFVNELNHRAADRRQKRI
jgi:hypothetical protein